VIVAEAIIDNLCEKGAFYVYDKYLRTKDKPYGILKSILSLAEMLQVTFINLNSHRQITCQETQGRLSLLSKSFGVKMTSRFHSL